MSIVTWRDGVKGIVLCWDRIHGLLRESCRAGIELPIFALGVLEDGVAVATHYFIACNVAGSGMRFRADAMTTYRALIFAEEAGLRVVALIHNHPSCCSSAPSHYDVAGMTAWPTIWVIYSCCGELSAWLPRLEEGRVVSVDRVDVRIESGCGRIVYQCSGGSSST